MFKEIDNLYENLMYNERIEQLLCVLENNYLTKKDYSYLKTIDAFEWCNSYQDVKTIVETILDLCIDNNKKLRNNLDVLMNKESEMKEEKKNAEYRFL